MKKQYVKPTIDSIEVEYEALMLTASSEQDSVGTGKDHVGDDIPGLSREHRGSWGDLWD